jgi:hypothetical protein
MDPDSHLGAMNETEQHTPTHHVQKTIPIPKQCTRKRKREKTLENI